MKEPQHVYIRDKELTCSFCGQNRFFEVKTKINQRTFVFWDVEWLAKNSVSYICTYCGKVQEFVGTRK